MMTRRFARKFLAVAPLALATGVVLPSFLAAHAAGQVSRPVRFDLVEEWMQAGERHAPGERDEALRLASSWDRNDLSEIRLHVDVPAEVAALLFASSATQAAAERAADATLFNSSKRAT